MQINLSTSHPVTKASILERTSATLCCKNSASTTSLPYKPQHIYPTHMKALYDRRWRFIFQLKSSISSQAAIMGCQVENIGQLREWCCAKLVAISLEICTWTPRTFRNLLSQSYHRLYLATAYFTHELCLYLENTLLLRSEGNPIKGH